MSAPSVTASARRQPRFSPGRPAGSVGVVTAAVALALLSGCTGPAKQGAAPRPGPLRSVAPSPAASVDPSAPSTARRPVGCVGGGRSVGLPEGWPRAFPLPPHLLVVSSTEAGAELRVTGMSGQGVSANVAYLDKGTARAGIEASHARTGSTEAESDFTGAGYQGHWRLRDVPGCAGHTQLSVSIVLD
jgi:hypothetical protein